MSSHSPARYTHSPVHHSLSPSPMAFKHTGRHFHGHAPPPQVYHSLNVPDMAEHFQSSGQMKPRKLNFNSFQPMQATVATVVSPEAARLEDNVIALYSKESSKHKALTLQYQALEQQFRALLKKKESTEVFIKERKEAHERNLTHTQKEQQ